MSGLGPLPETKPSVDFNFAKFLGLEVRFLESFARRWLMV